MLDWISSPPVLAASRMNPVFVHLVLPVALGFFVASVTVVLYFLGAKKRGEATNAALFKKLMVYGACGLIAGYFSMRIVIKGSPQVFGTGSALDRKGVKNILENPIPPQPEVKLQDPIGNRPRSQLSEEEMERRKAEKAERAEQSRKEHELRAAKQREDHEKRVQQQREEHEKRVAEMRKEADARRAAGQAEQAKARAAAEAEKTADEEYLASLSLDEVIAVREERKAAIDKAKEQMHSDDPEVKKAGSKAFSEAVKSYQTAFRAVMDKRRR